MQLSMSHMSASLRSYGPSAARAALQMQPRVSVPALSASCFLRGGRAVVHQTAAMHSLRQHRLMVVAGASVAEKVRRTLGHLLVSVIPIAVLQVPMAAANPDVALCSAPVWMPNTHVAHHLAFVLLRATEGGTEVR